MGLINQDIKNLVSGISQQPPTLRHPEQLQEQINGFSSEASGLQKRPPTLFVDVLSKYEGDTKPYIHWINRDADEQYCVIFDGKAIKVYDLEGTEYDVSYPNNRDYIFTNNPRRDLKMVTIADYTFITNTSVVTRIDPTTSPNVWQTQGLLVNIKSGQYGRKYEIIINGTSAALYETPDGSDKAHSKQIATDYIVDQLASQLSSKGYAVDKGSSWLRVRATINSFVVKDGFNNQAALGFTTTAQKFSHLPTTAPDGFVVLIKGEAGSDTDDYYVRYSEEDHVWKETLKPNSTFRYMSNTMPHVLVREADGHFTFKRASWAERKTGDDNSNPLPSFIDNTINDIFFHRNRLGFLSGENVILTQSGDFFNFWIQSAVKIQDTDPIDLAASDNTVTTLRHAVASDAELILFSDEAQFALTTNNVLTPKDAVLTPALTHFNTSQKAQPVNAGRNIYFVAERAEYSTVREFFTAQDNSEAKDAQDITSHCPNYIPNGVYKIITSTVENIMMFLTEGDENSVYVYKYLFVDGQRVQAAWSKWEFGTKVLGGAFIDSYLYLVIVRKGHMVLEKVSFTFDTKDFAEEPYRVLLDSKRLYKIPNAAYDAENDRTVLDIKTVFGDLYNPEAAYSAVSKDKAYDTTLNDSLIYMNGDYRGQWLTVGLNYIFKIVLSPILVKLDENGRTHALTEGRLQLKKVWFNYSNTGLFRVKVAHKTKGTTYSYIKTMKDIGTINAVIGEAVFSTGLFKFPALGNAEDVTITLTSVDPLPIALVGAGWIGNYQRKTRYF